MTVRGWRRQSQVSVTPCLCRIFVRGWVSSCSFTFIPHMPWLCWCDFRGWKSKVCWMPAPHVFGHAEMSLGRELWSTMAGWVGVELGWTTVSHHLWGENGRKSEEWGEWEKISFIQSYFALSLGRNINSRWKYDKTGKCSATKNFLKALRSVKPQE